ncbi:MAG: aryl-sulfate sulfotransferase [Promethearchaeota archaeon]
MTNSIKNTLLNNYQVLIVLSIITLFTIISGVIYYLSLIEENQEEENNPSDEINSPVFDGYNLFVLEDKNLLTLNRSLKLLITDMEGEVIIEKDYLKEPRGLDVYPVELFNTTTVLLGADDGAVLWNFVTNTTYDLGFEGHHDLEYNVNYNTFFTMSWYATEIDGILYGFDVIKEYDWQGNLQWSLDTREFVSPTMWCPFQDSYGEIRDLTHGNTVFYDSEEDIIYYNSRNCNTFWKIDHKTGRILWALGEYGDFQLFDRRGNLREHLFFHAHSVEKIDANTFILFDNDMHNQTDPTNFRSRILEIVVNETTMTANESWVWAAPVEYYTNIWGDADRLPNGNRLGTFGTETHPNTDIGPRLVEVTNEGEIVWELTYRTTEDYMYGIYRMERFRFTPTLSSQPNIKMVSTDSVNVSWQTWFNFRTKQQMKGLYAIFFDGTLIDSGLYTFEKWWLPSNLDVSLNNLSPRKHNLTVVLSDMMGGSTRNSVIIHDTTSSTTTQQTNLETTTSSMAKTSSFSGLLAIILFISSLVVFIQIRKKRIELE